MGVAPTLEHATLASEAKKDPSRGGLDGSVLLRQGAPEGEGGRGERPGDSANTSRRIGVRLWCLCPLV